MLWTSFCDVLNYANSPSLEGSEVDRTFQRLLFKIKVKPWEQQLWQHEQRRDYSSLYEACSMKLALWRSFSAWKHAKMCSMRFSVIFLHWIHFEYNDSVIGREKCHKYRRIDYIHPFGVQSLAEFLAVFSVLIRHYSWFGTFWSNRN